MMCRFARPSRAAAVVAILGLFPGCHGSSIPIGDFLSSGGSEGFGLALCVLALILAGAALARWARD